MEKKPILIDSSADVFEWISQFISKNVQTTTSLYLDRMKTLAHIAGNPEKSSPVIHTAGSKGKGSVTGMITAMLSAHGMKVGRYTSPHITEYRERITLGNDFFDESIYISAGKELVDIEEKLRNTAKTYFKDLTPNDTKAGFFELLTLYFFLCAREAQCEAMIVETGLGGRLDATNIVEPEVSVITLIEREHTEFLGNTLAEIAGEKAGIIKHGKPLVLAEQTDEALEVFKRVSVSKNAPLYYMPDIADIHDIQITREGTEFILFEKSASLFSKLLYIKLAIPGEIQAKNAAIAIIAAKIAFPSLSEKAIEEGLRNFTLPARFERLSDNPLVIADGAHTTQSIKACAETFTKLYGQDGVLIFGCAAGKDISAIAKILLPQFSRIIITTPGTFKLSFPQAVYEGFTEEALTSQNKVEISYIPETSTAIETALNLSKEKKLPLLCTGSFYLAAEIRNFDKIFSNA